MKLFSSLKTKMMVALGMLLASPAFAGTSGGDDPFVAFYDTIREWTGGALGTGLAITMLLMGGAIGVAKNSPMPALTGVAGAAFLNWGPEIIEQIMGYGALF